MPASSTLFAGKECCMVEKIRLVSKAVGVSLDIQDVSSKECPAMLPVKRVPCLKTGKVGPAVGGSTAIIRYLARAHPEAELLGRSFCEETLVDYYIDMIYSEVEQVCMRNTPEAKKNICSVVAALEKVLLKQTFLVGERMTLADIVYSSALCQAVRHKVVSCTSDLSQYVATRRLISTVYGKLGESCGCGADATAAAMKDGGSAKEGGGDAKGEEPAAGQKKSSTEKGGSSVKEKSQNQQQKAAESAPKGDEGEEEPKKKTTNPLDLLPASEFNLDAWKREYSNIKDSEGLYSKAMKYFWEHIDLEGWSFWYHKYDKLDDECQLAYSTSNMLSGFLQRLDNNFRKYSFGVIDVIGTEGCYDIQGVWLFRGQEIPFEMRDHPSYEYHTFTKLDTSKPEDKKLIADYWCAFDDVQGRPIADSKVWK